MKTFVMTASLAALFNCVSLLAQEAPRPSSDSLAERFKKLDRNGDGKLSAEEFPGPQFKQMDKNGDGFVTLEEAQAYFAGRRTAQPGKERTKQTEARPSTPTQSSGETFTWGMAVSDDAAARKLYGAVLGLQEFDPWNLPTPFSMKMYLSATGAGRVKFSSPQGQRPRDADAGPDAPGLRSVTLRVADLAAVRAGLTKRGAKIEGDKRLLVADPDGNRIYIEQAPPEAIKAAASLKPTIATRSTQRLSPLDRIRRQYGDIQPKEHKEEIAEHRPGEPPL